MKKLLLATLFAGAMIPAKAVFMLPAPEMLSETVEDGKVTITWQANTDEEITNYHLVVYKKHKAAAEERFLLADTDFGHIESTGTMTKHEERGAVWDYLPDCPGWYVKTPLYMDKAIGIDTFNQFAGSDNSDIFGGAYMLSPDYNLLGVAPENRRLFVQCALANEAESVTGGFALYTWSDDWWNEANYDYKPVEGHIYEYSDLSKTKFQDYSEECVPQIYVNHTRLSFYGSGYSALWINNLKVEAQLGAGDVIGYAADLHVLDAQEGVNSFEIDTTADTDDDFVYGYILRAVRMEFDEYRNVSTLRLISPCPEVHNIGDDFVAIDEVGADNDGEIKVSAAAGMISVEGVDAATAVEVFDLAGRKVAAGTAAAPVAVDASGVFVVKAGAAAAKVVL